MWPFSTIRRLEAELTDYKVYARKMLANAAKSDQDLRRANTLIAILRARLKANRLPIDAPELEESVE